MDDFFEWFLATEQYKEEEEESVDFSDEEDDFCLCEDRDEDE